MECIKFEKQCPSIKVSMEFGNEVTWLEATDNFISFLQACGYMFDPAEVGMYIIEQYTEPSLGFDDLDRFGFGPDGPCDGKCYQCSCK